MEGSESPRTPPTTPPSRRSWSPKNWRFSRSPEGSRSVRTSHTGRQAARFTEDAGSGSPHSSLTDSSLRAALRSHGADSCSRPVVQFSRQRSALHEKWIAEQLRHPATSSTSLPSTPAQQAYSPDSSGSASASPRPPSSVWSRSPRTTSEAETPLLETLENTPPGRLPCIAEVQAEDSNSVFEVLPSASEAKDRDFTSWLLKWCTCQQGQFRQSSKFCGDTLTNDAWKLVRRKPRSMSAPAALNRASMDDNDSLSLSRQRLIELLCVVGRRKCAEGEAEAVGDVSPREADTCVVFRYPAEAVPEREIGDSRIASFCLPHSNGASSSPGDDWQGRTCSVPSGTPFAFTVLASSVLPPGGPGHDYPDPTDLLYCTAVCFDDQDLKVGTGEGPEEEVAPYAYCIVSRHPFVAAFGTLLLQLDEEQRQLSEPDPGYIDVVKSISKATGKDSKWSMGNFEPRKLQSLFKSLLVELAGPVKEEAKAPPAAAPKSATSWTGHLRGAAAALRASAPLPPGCSPGQPHVDRARTVGNTRGDVNSRPLRDSSSGKADANCAPPAELGTFLYPTPQQLSCPPWARLEGRQRSDALLEWAALPLIECLEVDSLLQVLNALLLEFHVLVVTRSVARGSAVVLGLAALLWPFTWQHLLLPITPPALEEAIIEAPVPFLCAVRHLPRLGRGNTLVSEGRSGQACCTRFSRIMSVQSTSSVIANVASKSGVVIVQADKGTVSVPPDSSALLRRAMPHALRRRLPKLKRLREQLPSRSSVVRLRGLEECQEEQPPDEGQVRSKEEAINAMCSELHAGMVEIAGVIRNASREVRSELGSQGWLRQIKGRFVEASRSYAEPVFPCEFANTEMCLMFLAEASR